MYRDISHFSCFGSGAAKIGLEYEASKVRNASSLRTYAVFNRR